MRKRINITINIRNAEATRLLVLIGLDIRVSRFFLSESSASIGSQIHHSVAMSIREGISSHVFFFSIMRFIRYKWAVSVGVKLFQRVFPFFIKTMPTAIAFHFFLFFSAIVLYFSRIWQNLCFNLVLIFSPARCMTYVFQLQRGFSKFWATS